MIEIIELNRMRTFWEETRNFWGLDLNPFHVFNLIIEEQFNKNCLYLRQNNFYGIGSDTLKCFTWMKNDATVGVTGLSIDFHISRSTSCSCSSEVRYFVDAQHVLKNMMFYVFTFHTILFHFDRKYCLVSTKLQKAKPAVNQIRAAES